MWKELMGRDKPIARAIKLLSLIERNSNGLRVTDMADQLAAPSRAVYRDLDVLQQLKVPLFTDRSGRESYWKVDPSYRSKLSIPFTLSELLSLYLAQDSTRSLEGTVFYDSLQSLFEKVWAVLPKPLFRQMVELRGSFISGLPPQKTYGEYREFVNVIEEAVKGRKVLQLLYHPRNQSPAERRVNPYAVHPYNGSLYLIGHCYLRKDTRTFLVDRIRKIKQTDESFILPPGFSLASYLKHSFGMFTEDLVRVKVRFDKSLTRYLLERRWHPSQKNRKLKDGSLEIILQVAGTKEIRTWIMGFGSLAKVLEPASLVKEIKDDLGRALRAYARL
jgi:predicted DNA-binding transcriptional regulator YafY